MMPSNSSPSLSLPSTVTINVPVHANVCKSYAPLPIQKACLSALKKGRGSIVLSSSVNAITGIGETPYVQTKTEA